MQGERYFALIRAGLFLALLGGGLTGMESANAVEPSPPELGTGAAGVACDVAGLNAIAPADTTIVAAEWTGTAHTYCKITGFVTSTAPSPNKIGFELALPGDWSGRYYFGGNGGAAGSIQDPPGPHAEAGFAAAATDTGHQGSPTDFSSLAGNLARKLDYGSRSVHLVAVATQAMTKAYYAKPARYRYYRGCSKGGQQGLVEVQDYAQDFDGVITGAPGTGMLFPAFAGIAQHMGASAANWVSPAKLALFDAEVVAECDKLDGAVDGIVQHPQLCHAKPETLLCKPGDDSAKCLTPGEVATINFISHDFRSESGKKFYPGFSVTGVANAWPPFLTGAAPPNAPGTPDPWVDPVRPGTAAHYIMAAGPQAFYDDRDHFNIITDFHFDDATIADNRRRSEALGQLGEKTDFSAFVAHGGKLLIWQGWNDPLVSPYHTYEYYRRVADASQGGLDAVRRYARLFMAPAVEHCRGGIGPQDVGDAALAAMIDWVETGRAPDSLVANRAPSPALPQRSFKICAYPQLSMFNKGGEINDAQSYRCATPPR